MRKSQFSFTKDGVMGEFDRIIRVLTSIERRGKVDDYQPSRLKLNTDEPRDPSDGMTWLDTRHNKLKVWSGGRWREINLT